MRQVLQLHSIGRGMLEPGGCEKIHTELPEMQITVSEIKWPQLSKSWHFWHSYFFPSYVCSTCTFKTTITYIPI